MDIKRLSVDLAKDVFQLYGVDDKRCAILKKRLKSRTKFAEYITKLKPCEIIMEACGTANYWARKFNELGHTVKLISPQYVKPYVQRNKNDFRDSVAIMEASFWPATPYVSPKTVEQQDIQSLLRIRSNYMGMRTSVSNQVRGLLKEYGIFINKGYANLRNALPNIIDRDNENNLSPMMKELVEGQYTMLLVYGEKIDGLDIKIEEIAKSNETCKRLDAIEGVGPITALAMVAVVGDGKSFKNGRHFSAYLGLVPKQHSSGQCERLLGISKRGNRYLRELFVHGGRAVARTCDKKTDTRSSWVNRIKKQKGVNKAAVAVANKNARIAIAMILSGESYRKAA